ncbi:MAG: hypothetical protein QF371_00965 [Flavobacteriales bacterium]|nr:hypothetical protein [Flavobacteriales bacterium]
MRTSADDDKIVAAKNLETLFTDYYTNAERFDHELDSVPFLGQLSSSDGKVKMLCWNLALQNGEFKYYCVVRHHPDKRSVVVTAFQDNDSDWRKLLRKPLQSKNWYGALYYRILTHKHAGKTYYTLLGWDGNNPITNRKVVDVLTIQGNRISLGANLFKMDDRPTYRLVYEYSNDATMTLNYRDKEKMIVMDHLAPEDSRLEEQYQFYGPDFSYDGLTFKKGKWILKTDIFTKNKGLNNISKDTKPGSFTD